MKVSDHLFAFCLLALACVAASAPKAEAGDKPKSDWDVYFSKGIAPSYPFSGTLAVTSLGDFHASYTGVNGDMTSFYCSSTAHSIDCADGPGIAYALVQDDGETISVSNSPVFPSLFGPPEIGGNTLLESATRDAETGRIFHFRWTNLWIGGRPDVRVLCVPIAEAESIPDGKARKEYAKHHPMESCYFATPWPAPPKPSPEVQAIIDGIKAGIIARQDSAAGTAAHANERSLLPAAVLKPELPGSH